MTTAACVRSGVYRAGVVSRERRAVEEARRRLRRRKKSHLTDEIRDTIHAYVRGE
jgi:hypothetical protein